MRKLAAGITTALLIAVATGHALAQAPSEALEPVVDFFAAVADGELSVELITDPVAGVSHLTDVEGDFEHPSGGPPEFAPPQVDILGTWALGIQPGTVDLLGPTADSGFWAPAGHRHVETPRFTEGIHTFTAAVGHDGSQFEDGVILFLFRLAGPPPIEPKGRCEYVVWMNDLSRGSTFVNDPDLPRDPAGGTNLAFGVAINPVGLGMSSTFALGLEEGPGFVLRPDIDVRAYITRDHVGILAPSGQVDDLGAVNYYTFCAREGLGLDLLGVGIDQTGLTGMSLEDFGVVALEVRQPPPESTTTSLMAPTTTSAVFETTADVSDNQTADGQPISTWWLLPAGGLILAASAWMLLRNREPCSKLQKAWSAARQAAERAELAADEAERLAAKAQGAVDDLEERRRALLREWPPAGWDSPDGEWMEDGRGNRISAWDVHMRRMALGDRWSDFRAGKITAGEVEGVWRELGTPEFREKLRENDLAYRAQLSEIDAGIREASSALEERRQLAARARARVGEASEAAEVAEQSYQTCREGDPGAVHDEGRAT